MPTLAMEWYKGQDQVTSEACQGSCTNTTFWASSDPRIGPLKETTNSKKIGGAWETSPIERSKTLPKHTHHTQCTPTQKAVIELWIPTKQAVNDGIPTPLQKTKPNQNWLPCCQAKWQPTRDRDTSLISTVLNLEKIWEMGNGEALCTNSHTSVQQREDHLVKFILSDSLQALWSCTLLTNNHRQLHSCNCGPQTR